MANSSTRTAFFTTSARPFNGNHSRTTFPQRAAAQPDALLSPINDEPLPPLLPPATNASSSSDGKQPSRIIHSVSNNFGAGVSSSTGGSSPGVSSGNSDVTTEISANETWVKHLIVGSIAGIVTAIIILCLVLAYCCWKKRHRKHRGNSSTPSSKNCSKSSSIRNYLSWDNISVYTMDNFRPDKLNKLSVEDLTAIDDSYLENLWRTGPLSYIPRNDLMRPNRDLGLPPPKKVGSIRLVKPKTAAIMSVPIQI